MTKEEYWVEIIKMCNALEVPCTFSVTREEGSAACTPVVTLGRISGADVPVFPIQEAHRILKSRIEDHIQYCLKKRGYFDDQLDALEAITKILK